MALLEFFNFIKNMSFMILILVIFFLVYLYFNQNKMIYMPEVQGMCTREIKENPRGYINPSEHDLPYKEVRIKTKDGFTLYGWFIHKYTDSKMSKSIPTVIYFHENAGNIGFRLPFATYLVNKVDVNVLVVGYRGYGYSEGEPSEEGIMLDAEAIIDYTLHKENEVTKMINTNDVYIFGRSLGGAVAIYITEKLKPKIKGLILENTFSSMGDMVDHIFPILRKVKHLILANKWPSEDRVKNLAYPMLFISSERDEIVPCKHMDSLFTSASKATFKSKFVIIGGTHNESYQKVVPEYTNQIESFFKKCEALDENVSLIETSINDETSINREEETYLINRKLD